MASAKKDIAPKTIQFAGRTFNTCGGKHSLSDAPELSTFSDSTKLWQPQTYLILMCVLSLEFKTFAQFKVGALLQILK